MTIVPAVASRGQEHSPVQVTNENKSGSQAVPNFQKFLSRCIVLEQDRPYSKVRRFKIMSQILNYPKFQLFP
jgi:hypothetical protein